ncbi:hypothetical protein GBA52_010153 [Prunus armeniaca]|nr:hypothetical protein GBA52_010153 [Prunus armeniaca]
MFGQIGACAFRSGLILRLHWILTSHQLLRQDLSPVHLRRKSGGQYRKVFRVCFDLGGNSWQSQRGQGFTPRCPVNCCASTHFGENQLALGSSGISPLTTTHPLILQHQSVRTST